MSFTGPHTPEAKVKMSASHRRRLRRTAAKLVYATGLRRRKRLEAEATIPPHCCEYPGCHVLTKVKRVTPYRYEGRNQFCRRHVAVALDPGLKRFRARMPAALAKRLCVGPNPRAQRAEINRRISAGWARRAGLSQPQLDHLADLHAAKGLRPQASAGFMRLLHEKNLGTRSASTLLVIERRAVAADAKAYVRNIINGLRGPRPVYSLDEIDGYLKAGRNAEWIAEEIGLSVRQVRTAIQLLREADAAGTL